MHPAWLAKARGGLLSPPAEPEEGGSLDGGQWQGEPWDPSAPAAAAGGGGDGGRRPGPPQRRPPAGLIPPVCSVRRAGASAQGKTWFVYLLIYLLIKKGFRSP